MPVLLGGGSDVSKFNTSKGVGAFDVRPSAAGSTTVSAYDERPGSATPIHDRPTQLVDTRPNVLQKACFLALCTYLLSGFANEFALRLLNNKAYLSTVTVVLVPILFLMTGSALRGVWLPFGKWWVAFGLWLAICAPFSVWKTNTFQVLFTFYFRSYLLYFVICACVLTARRTTTLLYVLGIGNLLVVLSCIAYGSFDESGRFSVVGSNFSFLANANELALQLLMGVTALIFFFFRKGWLMKGLVIGIIAVSFAYMLKTGSRGVLVAAVATTLALFLLSRRKVLVAAMAAILFLIALAVLPSTTLHRLTYIATGDTVVTDQRDASSLASQLQRERLFRDSVRLTFQNPIVGVGPGEFMVAQSNEKEKKGQSGEWRQTHNSYTQVSSEAGLPAFIFFVGAILSCFRLNYRIYRQTVGKPGLEDYAGLSFCMLLGLVAFSTGAIFDQLAYTSHLAILGGITTATYLAAQPALRGC